MIYLKLFTSVILVGLCASLPTGAPQSACLTLKPNHKGNQPQPLANLPYSVTASSASYKTPNDKIAVHLKSIDGATPFKGFLISAKNEVGKAFGSWAKSSLAHEISCSAVTHNSNVDKLNVELKWQPPANATTGRVVMTAAVVQNFTIFWINIPVTVDANSVGLQASASSVIHKVLALPEKNRSLLSTVSPNKHNNKFTSTTKPVTGINKL